GNSESADYIHITLKCILQLLLIQTLGELFESEALYTHMSAHHLFILLDCVDQSRSFAHRFNKNRKVRRRLVEMGVMPTMPSLLKQETLSMLTELYILQRMNSDAIGITVETSTITSDRAAVADEVDDRLAAIAKNVLEQYCAGGPGHREDNSRTVHIAGADVSAKNAGTASAKKGAMIVSSWRPCVVVLLKYLPELAKSPMAPKPFQKAVRKVWPELVDLLGVAADAQDLDIVGDVQRVLALAASEFGIVEDNIETA
ncbi:guanine nucleotide exchange protein for ADP-robosylation factor, partial [Linderina pennispora]